MNDDINYKANPLHSVSLKNVLIALEGHYGFEILFAYLKINCFKTNPSIDSSVIFLKKTDWAREKVEAFYLYEFKNLPRASDEQFQLPPRNRIVPKDQTPREPAELSLEDAERLHEKRAKKAAAYNSESRNNYRAPRNSRQPSQRGSDGDRKAARKEPSPSNTSADPWGKWKK